MFIKDIILDTIPDENHKLQVQILIEKMAKKILNMYQSVNRYERELKKARSKIKKFGLNEHGNYDNTSQKDKKLQRHRGQMRKFIKHHSKHLPSDIKIQENLLLVDIKRNVIAIDLIKDKFYNIFVKRQNKLHALMSKNVSYGCNLVMAGIINNWSRAKWNKFNMYVCFCSIIVIFQ